MDARIYTVAGFRDNGLLVERVYEGAHVATSDDEALTTAERACAGRLDVDEFEVVDITEAGQ